MRVLATLLTTSLVVATSEAFAPSAFVRPSSSTRIFGTTANKVDTSDAIRVAKEASETFGATSAEARIAWEDVEEIDASNRYVSKQVETRSLFDMHQARTPAAISRYSVGTNDVESEEVVFEHMVYNDHTVQHSRYPFLTVYQQQLLRTATLPSSSKQQRLFRLLRLGMKRSLSLFPPSFLLKSRHLPMHWPKLKESRLSLVSLHQKPVVLGNLSKN